MNILKTEQEVKEEIEATIKTIGNVRKAYKEGKITKELLKIYLTDLQGNLSALRWVLGENDRHD